MSGGSDTKTCPWCGEDIKAAAIICRFCRNDATPQAMEQAREFASRARPAPAPTPQAPAPPPKIPAGDPTLNRMAGFVPRTLLQGIIDSTDAANEGERRPISVLFADLAGFTSLTEEIGAEAMSDLLHEVHAAIRDQVAKYGGLVEKFMGDGVMALFGAPVAHGDDPERAIRAAFDIREVVRRIGMVHEFDLDVHSGIGFGEVVFEGVGVQGRPDFQTIGDAVNLASRLQGIAKAGETLVDHRIYVQTRTIFEWKSLPAVEVKGKKEPIKVHQVSGILKQFSKVTLGERIDMVPLVGRGAELKKLKAAADRAAEGQIQVAVLLGEAGIGKSRLIHELKRQIGEDATHWFSGSCLSYGTSIPFLPFVKLLRSVLGLGAEVESAVTVEALQAAVGNVYAAVLKRTRSAAARKDLKRMRDQVLHALAILFSIAAPANPLLALSPRERREQLFEAVTDLLGRLCGEKPVVLVLEDFQWSDQESWHLLDHLIRRMQDKPLAMLLSMRPETEQTLPDQKDLVQIELKELNARDSERLLAKILHIGQLPKDLRETIVQKAEGNPFYIEEIVLNLEDRGILERKGEKYRLTRLVDQVEIPDSVEGVVLARLDRLERHVRRVVQYASVIGQEFQFQTLAHVIRANEDLRQHLLTLLDEDYILQQSLLPELIYIFRHLVLREVAYGTLLERRKRQFHGNVAQAIEQIFPERAEEFCEILAFHYEKGRVTDKALHYLEQAALKCENIYANHAAIDHWQRLLATIRSGKREDEETRRLRLRALLSLGELCRLTGRIELAIQANEEAEEEARKLKDKNGLGRALTSRAEALRLAGRIDEGLELLAEARKLAHALKDDALLAYCINMTGHLERIRGRFKAAAKAFGEVLELGVKTGNRQYRFQALNHLGIIRMYEGRPEEANTHFREAFELAAELGFQGEQVQIQLNIGINHLRLGQCEQAGATLAGALEHAEKIESERGAQLCALALIDLHLKMGDFGKATALCRQLIKRNDKHPYTDVRALALANQARALVAQQRLTKVDELVEKALALSESDGNYVGRIDALAVGAELELARENGQSKQQALSLADQALTLVQKHKEQEFLPAMQNLGARVRLALDQPEEARKIARQAVDTSRKAVIPREEGWALLTLAQCERALGRHAAAKRALEDALERAKTVQDAALVSHVVQLLNEQ